MSENKIEKSWIHESHGNLHYFEVINGILWKWCRITNGYVLLEKREYIEGPILEDMSFQEQNKIPRSEIIDALYSLAKANIIHGSLERSIIVDDKYQLNIINWDRVWHRKQIGFKRYWEMYHVDELRTQRIFTDLQSWFEDLDLKYFDNILRYYNLDQLSFAEKQTYRSLRDKDGQCPF